MEKKKKLVLLPDDLEAIIIEKDKKPFVIILKDHIQSIEKDCVKVIGNNERNTKYLKEYLDKFNNL